MLKNANLQTMITQGLHGLGKRPDWLTAGLQPDRVLASLTNQVPEAARGEIRFTRCEIPRLFLKKLDATWFGTYTLDVERGGKADSLPVHATLTAPGLPPLDVQALPEIGFGETGWSVLLPDLRMTMELEPPEVALEGLEQLLDPETACPLIASSIRKGRGAYVGFQIERCTPRVLNYKPGSRCTIRYRFDFPPDVDSSKWPQAVIAKTYRGRKGEQAFHGMEALWRSSLASGDVVRISEPLAYVPEHRLMVQTQLPGDRTLEDLIRSALETDNPDGDAQLIPYIRKTAVGLAHLHRSGVQPEETVQWEERFTDVPELLERIAVFAPDRAAQFDPLVDFLRTAAMVPADPLVPSHGTFDGDQVIIDQDRIGFIDFDSICMAEPALDAGHFRAAVMDSGMKLIDDATLQDPDRLTAYLDRLNHLGNIFLEPYAALAKVSPQRLAVWEALDYFRDALHFWTKPKPDSRPVAVRILEYHLRKMGLQI